MARRVVQAMQSSFRPCWECAVGSGEYLDPARTPAGEISLLSGLFCQTKSQRASQPARTQSFPAVARRVVAGVKGRLLAHDLSNGLGAVAVEALRLAVDVAYFRQAQDRAITTIRLTAQSTLLCPSSTGRD